MWRKRLQLGLIHTAVAITLVPFTSTLNRVMIYEMGIAATIVTLLVAIPYLFSPIQVMIGSYADRNPILGFRRTPYITLGLLLCVGGVLLAPYAVAHLSQSGWTIPIILLSVAAFGAWGMGYNFASVSYLSLASEIDAKERGLTIAVMFFMMIIGIIITAVGVSRVVETYSLATLTRAFQGVGITALVLGVVGLIGLESRSAQTPGRDERYSWMELGHVVLGQPQSRLFFVYLVVLLAALLGQDVLLEPFGAQAFGLSVEATTRITSIWGTCMLVALLAAGWLQRRFTKRIVAGVGAWVALIAFLGIGISGLITNTSLFYAGVVALGVGTGLSTVANLSLMLDMTTVENVGLFIGAWGMANAISRLIGQLMSGVVRDIFSVLVSSQALGYVVVFGIEAAFLALSLVMLRAVNVAAFQEQATSERRDLLEQAVLMSDALGN